MTVTLKLRPSEAEAVEWALVRGWEALRDVDPALRDSYGPSILKVRRLVQEQMEAGSAVRVAAKEFLVQLLRKRGPMQWQEIVRIAGPLGHKEATLRRARADAGVRRLRVGNRVHWGVPRSAPREKSEDLLAQVAHESAIGHGRVNGPANVTSLVTARRRRSQ